MADSAKQQRISTAVYRRIYYFLTADERTGDLLSELVTPTARSSCSTHFARFARAVHPDPHALSIGLGTGWSGQRSAAWLAEWERRGLKADAARSKLIATMETIAAMPNGFVTGSGLYDLDTGRFAPVTEKTVNVSHLSAMFGQVEICAEVIDLVGMSGSRSPGCSTAACSTRPKRNRPSGAERTSVTSSCVRGTRG